MIRVLAVFYLVAGISGCIDRKNCPSCMLADPLVIGCPYQGSQLSFGNGAAPTVLALSGGASHGAWGAGVISGWPDPGPGVTGPRPTFDIVTGISTGALQAPYAFLGTDYDDDLEKFYTTSTNADIYSMKPDFLISNALQDRTPLRQILEENVTAPEVRKVASMTNRELYVGTINLDTSQFCEWNLSTIARNAAAEVPDSPAEACWVDLFRDAMFASAGAPVIAPPVEIDVNACKPGNPPPQKMLFADGGVRQRVFVSEVIEKIPNGKPTVYVIMNGQMSTRPTCVSNQLMPLALRTYEIMDHVALYGSLYEMMSEHVNDWSLRLSRIPDAQCVSLPAFEFDPVRMKAMFNGGSAWVQQPSPWETTVPAAAVANWPTGVAKPPMECAQPSAAVNALLAPCPM
jgi:predicted acylesterase/phospholipase RssA